MQHKSEQENQNGSTTSKPIIKNIRFFNQRRVFNCHLSPAFVAVFNGQQVVKSCHE
jgi:hypothetical protein